MLQAEFAVAKVAKYAVRESGDSVEIIERPRGGLSVVIADGQRSGRSAKAISNIAVQKAVSLLAEGVRDGAVARAAHDYLRTQSGGQVSAELIIVSLDLETRTLVVSRNSRCPVLICNDGNWQVLDEPAEAVGTPGRIRPVIVEMPLAPRQVVVAFTDGLTHAGERAGRQVDLLPVVQQLVCQPGCTPTEVADGLLQNALRLDDNRPADDIAVVVASVREHPEAPGPEVRRMAISFPVPPG